MTDMNKLIEEMNGKKKEWQDSLKNSFKEILKDYFDKTGTQAIIWAQYTPGFNDGDPCEFSLTEVCHISKGFDKENLLSPYEYDDEEEFEHSKGEYVNSLNSFIHDNYDFLENAFGNNVAIYITPEEIITEEYDCGY